MAIAYVKQLVHEDGEPFVIWHRELNVYCPVMCDSDVPPDPETLDLDIEFGDYRDFTLRWSLTGEAYDSTTGESIWQKPLTERTT